LISFDFLRCIVYTIPTAAEGGGVRGIGMDALSFETALNHTAALARSMQMEISELEAARRQAEVERDLYRSRSTKLDAQIGKLLRRRRGK